VYTKPITMRLVDVLMDSGEVSGVYFVDFGAREAETPVRKRVSIEKIDAMKLTTPPDLYW